ncbi:MAG TPA: tetratricopeptide repeat protein [Gemmatimonadales bacterium]|nr:tetratricopeptide repeat protein [Gemmatimonadales bacterium]
MKALGLSLVVIMIGCGPPPPPVTPNLSGLEALQALEDSGKDVPRPRLRPGVDTNDAASYFRFGEQLVLFNDKLDTAEMALYWASRLDPALPEPFFVRSLIPLSALRSDAFETWRQTRSLRSIDKVTLTERQVRIIDSLQQLAWHRNPFMFSALEFRDVPPIGGRRHGGGDPIREGWWAFSDRRFSAAESLFAVGLKKHPDQFPVRIYRARALFYLGRYDGAVAELQTLRDTLVHTFEAHISPLVLSVEMLDFAIGIARVQQDSFAAARAAFERALTENLGFYWAHARLAGADLALHDTAGAIAELETATQLEGRDPVLLFYKGVVLQSVGRAHDAREQFERAIELDPYYAAPYFWLAFGQRKSGDTVSAVLRYREFLLHAARNDPDRELAQHALDSLSITTVSKPR